MAKDYVTVDRVQAPVYVTGERFPTRNNVGEALKDLEQSRLVALTGITGAKARLVAPLNDNVWGWFTSLTGIYNITDHEGRFGKKGEKVNVVSHGLGHPLSRSQRVIEALGTDYTKQNGTAQLSQGEEIELLSEEGTPIFAYDKFLEASEDPNFLKANPSLRVIRTQKVLGSTTHSLQSLGALYDNSSVLCYVGGRTPVQVATPEGEKTVTIAQALVDRTGEKFNRTDAGVWLHNDEGGRLLVFGVNYNNGLNGINNLNLDARFVGVSAGGAKDVAPRSGDASEQRVVVPSLEQVLHGIESNKRILSEDAKEQLENYYRNLFKQ